jgi:hypothetical protein
MYSSVQILDFQVLEMHRTYRPYFGRRYKSYVHHYICINQCVNKYDVVILGRDVKHYNS